MALTFTLITIGVLFDGIKFIKNNLFSFIIDVLLENNQYKFPSLILWYIVCAVLCLHFANHNTIPFHFPTYIIPIYCGRILFSVVDVCIFNGKLCG